MFGGGHVQKTVIFCARKLGAFYAPPMNARQAATMNKVRLSCKPVSPCEAGYTDCTEVCVATDVMIV